MVVFEIGVVASRHRATKAHLAAELSPYSGGRTPAEFGHANIMPHHPDSTRRSRTSRVFHARFELESPRPKLRKNSDRQERGALGEIRTSYPVPTLAYLSAREMRLASIYKSLPIHRQTS